MSFSDYLKDRELSQVDWESFFIHYEFSPSQKQAASAKYRQLITELADGNTEIDKMFHSQFNNDKDKRDKFWRDMEEEENKLDHYHKIKKATQDQCQAAAADIVHDVQEIARRNSRKSPYRLRPTTVAGTKRSREEGQSSAQTTTASSSTSNSDQNIAAGKNSPSKKAKSLTFALLEEELESQGTQSDSDYIGSNPPSARSSLNSIDMGFMNHLVGPGTTSSRLETSAHLMIGDTNVSEILMDARRSVVKRQSEVRTVSELLVLNFIFDAKFVQEHLSPEVFSAIPPVPVPTPEQEEKLTLFDCSTYASSHSYKQTKQYVRALHSETLIGEILRSYTSRPNLWKDNPEPSAISPPLPSNEDTYIQDAVRHIIIGVFGDLDCNDHWTRDPLPTPIGFEEQYYPDYCADKFGLAFAALEVKKPEEDDLQLLERDRHKLPCMLKLMLDRLLEAGVKDPVVIGFLVAESRCNIFFMSLEHEALYMLKSVGSFELPRNNLQLGLLNPALGCLHAAQESATNTLAAIQNLTKAGDTTKAWRRPSYYIQGIKVPAPLPETPV
ncbi:hypothetical protein BGX27_009126 [Mortierella sp. AM989]|nr:hypothetical protein BGX27_009126 [Mortierella sp. AM989]